MHLIQLNMHASYVCGFACFVFAFKQHNMIIKMLDENNMAQSKTDKWLLISSSFSSFFAVNCCLSVVLELNKGDYPENVHVVFCPNKWCSFKPFMYFGFVFACLLDVYVVLLLSLSLLLLLLLLVVVLLLCVRERERTRTRKLNFTRIVVSVQSKTCLITSP